MRALSNIHPLDDEAEGPAEWLALPTQPGSDRGESHHQISTPLFVSRRVAGWEIHLVGSGICQESWETPPTRPLP